MSEHEPHITPEARLAPERASPDWRRLIVARDRFLTPIADGIAQATAESEEIDGGTARCIAHALGRAYGPGSARHGNAHDPDEWIRLDDVLEAIETIVLTVIDWCGEAEA